MPSVTQSLTAGLDSDLRNRIRQRVSEMMRQVRYLEESQNSRLREVREAGWTLERIELLAALNSFYQVVLGPLASSARKGLKSNGRAIPILYGDSIRFDRERSAAIQRAHLGFFRAIEQVPDPGRLLEANHADDMVYRLSLIVSRRRQ